MVASPASVVRLGTLALVVWLFQAQTLSAQPFEGGTLSWSRDTTFVSATQSRFNLYIRLTVQWNGAVVPTQPSVGQVVTASTFRLRLIRNNLVFQTPAFTLTVMEVNAAENWFVGQTTLPLLIQNTNLPALVQMNQCCRSPLLLDGNGTDFFRLETTVPGPAGAVQVSPSAVMPSRLYWLQNETAQAQIGAENVEGALTRFALASNSPAGGQSALTQARPGTTLNVDAAGLVSWTPNTVGLHAVQFRINTVDAGGVVLASVPYDTVIDVVSECAPSVIGCNTPPAFTPETPGVFPATVHQEMQVPISATDADFGDTVTVEPVALPADMTFTPGVAAGGSAEYVLAWTPTRPDLLRPVSPQTGMIERQVCFNAQDSRGAMTGAPYCVTIQLDPASGTPPVVTCPAPQTRRGGSLGVVPVTLEASIEGADGQSMNVFWVTAGGNTPSETVSGLDTHTWSLLRDLGVGTHLFEARAAFATGDSRVLHGRDRDAAAGTANHGDSGGSGHSAGANRSCSPARLRPGCR